MPAPFELDRGVWIEDRALLLPWLTARRDLMTMGSPKVRINGETAFLSWEGIGLGGLHGGFQTRLGNVSIAKPQWYEADRLVQAEFWCDDPAMQDKDAETARQQYQRRVAHFERLIGQGREIVDGGGYPHMTWEFPTATLAVSVHERMMEYCTVSVHHADFDPFR